MLSPKQGFPNKLTLILHSSCEVEDLAEKGRTPKHFITARLRLPVVKRSGRGPATPSGDHPSLSYPPSIYIYLFADIYISISAGGRSLSVFLPY